MQAFVDESMQRRYLLVAAVVLDRDLARLRGLVRDLILPGQRRIHLEKETGCAERLHYLHLRAHQECLLGLPDAIAWCWAKGQDWRRMVEPIVGGVRRL